MANERAFLLAVNNILIDA